MIQRVANSNGEQRRLTLQLIAAGLASSRNLQQPASWTKVSQELYQDGQTRAAAIQLGAIFNDQQLYAEMRDVLQADNTNLRDRKRAVELLSSSSEPTNLPALLKNLDQPELRLAILRQLGRYSDLAVAESLLERLPNLAGAEQEAALEALCGRASFATKLLDAIGAKQIEKSLLTGYYARQMAQLNDPAVTEQLTKQWGRLTQTSAERKAAMAKLVDAYKKAPHWAYNRGNGANLFQKNCASCHLEQNGVARIGPKLNGTGSKGIEYIVENIMDPNAVIGEDFLARNVITIDGQVVSGVVIKETDTAMTIRTSNSTVVIAKDDIEDVVVSKNSFMPEGLLKTLSEREKIELLMYLLTL